MGRYLRLPEVAEITGMAVQTLRNLALRQRMGIPTAHASPLPFSKLGRNVVVKESELREWLDYERRAAERGVLPQSRRRVLDVRAQAAASHDDTT